MIGTNKHYEAVSGSCIDGIQLYGIALDGETLIANAFDDKFEVQAFVNYINYANLEKSRVLETLSQYMDSPHRILRDCNEK